MPLAAGAIFLGLASSPLTIGAVAGARAQQPGHSSMQPATVIMQCVYYSASPSTGLRTEVQGIEVSGRNDVALAPGGQCSDAIAHLSLLGFELIHSTSAVADYNADGDVDGRDFLIWQKQY
jgi:hypothetical protein